MSSSSDFEDAVIDSPVVRKRRNINEIEPVEGEANLKGFVSAFSTIMERKEPATLTSNKEVSVSSPPVAKKINVLHCHNKQPAIDNEAEQAFEATAKRGVMKLFKAMSMRKSTTRRVPRANRRVKPIELTGTVGAASMTSFLELLKAQKTGKK